MINSGLAYPALALGLTPPFDNMISQHLVAKDEFSVRNGECV
jgi:hypothetical protein